MQKPELKLVAIRTMDIDRVGNFYRCLGLRFAGDGREDRERHYLVAGLSNWVFQIDPANTPNDVDRNTRLGFEVRDFHSTINALRACEAQFIREPLATNGDYKAVARDPDGRVVDLYSRQSRLRKFVRFLRRLGTLFASTLTTLADRRKTDVVSKSRVPNAR